LKVYHCLLSGGWNSNFDCGDGWPGDGTLDIDPANLYKSIKYYKFQEFW
jgi:hypothetical protein